MSVADRLRQTITIEQLTLALGSEAPWDDGAEWGGYFDATTGDQIHPDFMPEGIAIQIVDIDFVVMTKVVHGDYVDTPCCIALKDGRFNRDGVRQFASWQTWSDVTGSGFHGDAYGGDSKIFMASTADRAIRALIDHEAVATDTLTYYIEYSSVDPAIEQVMMDAWLCADVGIDDPYMDRVGRASDVIAQVRKLADDENYQGSVIFRLAWAKNLTTPVDVE